MESKYIRYMIYETQIDEALKFLATHGAKGKSFDYYDKRRAVWNGYTEYLFKFLEEKFGLNEDEGLMILNYLISEKYIDAVWEPVDGKEKGHEPNQIKINVKGLMKADAEILFEKMNKVLKQLNTKDEGVCHQLDELSKATGFDLLTIEFVCKKIQDKGDCSFHHQCTSVTRQGIYTARNGGYKHESSPQVHIDKSITFHDKAKGNFNTGEIKGNQDFGKAPKRSVLEIIAWVVGIGAGIVAIYEFFIKKFL